ncbi:hypothetical protein HPP92_010344 [Vanilla planifolia]|uniref:Uncharacterized protein n=1 Tax=Vanilla planifolia TaxID=51239 RepID=A0A835V1C2_VANPL|nr:hypothetical protein HPP92_010344 [Vanilla planifolia]
MLMAKVDQIYEKERCERERERESNQNTSCPKNKIGVRRVPQMPSANPKLSGHFFHQQGVVEKKKTRLSRRPSKEKAKISLHPAPAAAFLVGEEARARFKHECLLQDYLELLRRGDLGSNPSFILKLKKKNKRFREAVQKKLKLLAEVKFLRKKYGSLSNASWPSPCNMKKQAHKVPLPPKPVDGPRIPFIQCKIPLEERNHKSKEVSVRRAPKLLDLNQNGEEMEAFEVEWEPLQLGRMKGYSLGGDAMANDIKVSVCRDVESGSNQAGKRKISWQDHLALRV